MCRDEFVTVRPRMAKAQRGDILDETIEAPRRLLDTPRGEKAVVSGKHVEFGAVAHDQIEGLKPVPTEHGRDIGDIDVVAEAQLRLAPTSEQAIAAYEASRQGQFSLLRGAKLEKLVTDSWIGTPDEVRARIRAVAAQGITHFNVLHVSGDTMMERLEQMQMFAEDVMRNVAD